MPANLPPQYYELEREFKAEKDTREKLRMAEELLRIMPKHKGTDKLQAEMKAKISELKKKLVEGDKTHGAKHVVTHDHVEPEGSGQAILIGAPNTGKSSLVDSLTHAKPAIGDYPYTTREPQAGMMTFENVQIQLIDTPPISDEMYESYMTNLVREANTVLLVVDLLDAQWLPKTEFLLFKLAEKHIELRPRAEKSEDVRMHLKHTIIVAHKSEDASTEAIEAVKARFPEFDTVVTSVLDEDSLNRFRRTVFDSLGVIRVYTKQVGKEPSLDDPVVLPKGATVEDAAASIHKDFAAKLKFARAWGKDKFDGQRVQRDYQLEDGDVLEFHI